ncbi:organic solvent tolerance protein OstA [Prolixibacteraceae bacterium JC049]|nr:organic solvent tolerance protein OstA [Prolixibacteraceae bacterium JC049]
MKQTRFLKKYFGGARWIILASFCFIMVATMPPQKKQRIIIKHADKGTIVPSTGYRKLINNVWLIHDSVDMHCDSAYFSQEKNTFEGFGKVHAEQGDTVHMYGQYVKYTGDNKKAKIRRKVKLINPQLTLTTDSLDFDYATNVGAYDYGAEIVDTANVLTSRVGRYFVSENLFLFSDSVKLVNDDFTMYSDTLKYNTETGVVFIVGKTRIVSEEGTLLARGGWYDTRTGLAKLTKDAELHKGDQVLKGDSILYDKEGGVGKAFGNVCLNDAKNQSTIYGRKAVYHRNLEKAMVTDSALYVQVAENDTLFLHADTLRASADTIPDERIIRAYNNVRFFRTDFQGKCDSLVYESRDSVMSMFYEPILWAQGNELKSEFMKVVPHKGEAYRAYLKRKSFVIAQEDSAMFNQIKGREMIAYINNRNLYKVNVNGNAQSVYYFRDGETKDAPVLGLNKVECSSILMHFKDRRVVRITSVNTPESIMIPLEQLNAGDKELRDFHWNPELRPINRYDVFRRKGGKVIRKKEEKKKETGLKEMPLEEDFR